MEVVFDYASLGVGTRLLGAFVATLGLPQFNPVNEELRRRLAKEFGEGYDYTYLFPGIRKVVQAAGRVIRTTSDIGSIHLIDDRFARPEVLRLLPSWWNIDDTPLKRDGFVALSGQRHLVGTLPPTGETLQSRAFEESSRNFTGKIEG